MLREIHIKPVLNGYIVCVGCQTLVFTDPVHLTNELLRYCGDATKMEAEYRLTALNREVLSNAGPEPARAEDPDALRRDLNRIRERPSRPCPPPNQTIGASEATEPSCCAQQQAQGLGGSLR